MPREYRHNHYVPVWYQKRFVLPNQVDQELLYLDIKPKPFIDPLGIAHPRRNPRRQGYRLYFAEEDLYTHTLGGVDYTEIERLFFGKIDSDGLAAVDYFCNFAHPWNGRHFTNELLLYMTTQKLRTPKGLAWLAARLATTDKNTILREMIALRQIYGAVWSECVWLLADASHSETKFIISDHPVTVYNRRCGPRSIWCKGDNDPDIRYHGTHTIFPLSLEKILILTNLSWVRNPYQRETDLRPHPNFYHDTIMSILDIQTLRYLTEDEVRQINFIIKSRAHRYIAAGREDWLYPEQYVSKADWRDYGSGYLLMPDPRSVRFQAETIVQFRDGRVQAVDEFGRKPGHPEYSGGKKSELEDWDNFHRFQGEFATQFGPARRGRAYSMMRLDDEYDSDDFHQYHLGLYRKRIK